MLQKADGRFQTRDGRILEGRRGNHCVGVCPICDVGPRPERTINVQETVRAIEELAGEDEIEKGREEGIEEGKEYRAIGGP